MARPKLIELLERRRLLADATLLPQQTLGDSFDSAIADLNHDSHADVVTATWTGISVAYGNGTGAFPTRFNVAVPAPTGSYYYVKLADFNGDGRPDIVAHDSTRPEVVVVFQLASGFFGPAQRVAVAGVEQFPAAFGIATPDLNGDGRADIVVGNGYQRSTNQSNISILLADPAGGFAAHVEVDIPSVAHNLVSSDFDGDGNQDLVVVSYPLSYVPGSAYALSFFAGNGDGTFAAPEALTYGNPPSYLAAGDLTGDGIADLVTSTPGNLSIYSMSGATVVRTDVATRTDARDVTVADFDSDGRHDIIVAGDSGVTVHLQQSSGFIASNTTPPLGNYRLFRLADFNEDGYLDASLISRGSLNEIWFGGPGGMFKDLRTDVMPGPIPDIIRTADINGDGTLDIITRRDYVVSPSQVYTPVIYVGYSNGSGGFTAPVTYQMPESTPGYYETTVGLLAADVNGDGRVDLAIGRQISTATSYLPSKLCILYGLSGGGFGNYTEYPTIQAMRDVVAADFNLDGRTDVVTSGPSGARIHYGQPGGTLGGSAGIGISGEKVIVCDLNNDGRKDLLSNAGATILINRPTGFQPVSGSSFPYEDFDLADMNGDGLLDVVATDFGSASTAGRIWVFPGLPTTAASTVYFNLNVSPQTAPNHPHYLRVGDISGDSVPDAAFVCGGSSERLGVMLGNGAGTFAEPEFFSASSSQWSIAMGDVTGDGRLDVVSGVNNGATVFRNLGTFNPTFMGTSAAVDLDQTRSITINVSRPIKATTVTASDLQILNLTTGGNFVATAAVLSGDRKSIRFNLPANMADGNYRFTLPAASIGDFVGQGMSADFVEAGPDSYILTGDVNHDRSVNFDDLLIVSRNYGKIGQTFAQGNVTRDAEGRVDFDDLLRLAQHYGTTLFVATPTLGRRAAGPRLIELS